MSRPGLRRRELLASLGGAAATAVLSGCLGDGGADAPGSDAPAAWAPTPANLHSDLDHYQVFSSTPATVETYADQLDPTTWEQYKAEWVDWQLADPEPAQVERFTRGGDTDTGVGFAAVTHDIDGDLLRDNLREAGFEKAGTYEEFDVFATPDGGQARALAGRRLAVGRHPTDAAGVVETVVDTGLGSADRYRDREELSDLVTSLDTTGNFRFSTFPRNDASVPEEGVFLGSVARGYSLAFDDEFTGKRAEWFADDVDIPDDQLEAYALNNPLFDGAENIDLLRGDNLGLLEYTIALGGLSLNQLG